MIIPSDIKIIDITIPSFEYKGVVYILQVEEFMHLIAETLPPLTNPQYYEGYKVVPGSTDPRPATEDDVTIHDVIKFIITHLDDWREENEEPLTLNFDERQHEKHLLP